MSSMSFETNPAATKAGALSRKFVAVAKMVDNAESAWAGDVIVVVGTVASMSSITPEVTLARLLPLAPGSETSFPSGSCCSRPG